MQNEMINEDMVKRVVMDVVSRYQGQSSTCLYVNPQTACVTEDVEILVEASGRHVHLSVTDIERLFGKGYKLTPKKDLSQIGQFACEERVTLIGPKNIYRNVAVLGPARDETQVELSLSDARFLGVNAPMRMSGDLKGAADIIIATDKESISAKSCAIVAQNHIHMTPPQAKQWGFTDGEIVSVKMKTDRPLTFDNAVIRVSEKAGLAMHIDFDEANACNFNTGDIGIIIRQGSAGKCTNVQASKYQEKKPEKKVMIDKHFVTEYDLQKANVKSITLSKGTLVSALGRDYAKKENIELTFI